MEYITPSYTLHYFTTIDSYVSYNIWLLIINYILYNYRFIYIIIVGTCYMCLGLLTHGENEYWKIVEMKCTPALLMYWFQI